MAGVTASRRGSMRRRGGGPAYYVGARIQGLYQFNNRGASTADDAPFSLNKAAPNTVDTFEGTGIATPTGSGMGGKHLSMVQWGTAGSPAWPAYPLYPASTADLVNTRGMFSMYTLGFTAAALTDILADNATARTAMGNFFTSVKNHGRPVIVRMLWEFNGNWSPPYPWQTGSGVTSANFVTIWRNLWKYAADATAGVTIGSGLGTGTGNMSFFWCPNYWTSAFTTIANPLPWYPGDQYVDWVGWDGYQRSSDPAKGSTDSYWDPMSRFKSMYDTLATAPAISTTKPMMIGEFGVSNTAASPGASAWLASFFDNFLPACPRIKGFHYFDQPGNDGTDLQLEDLVLSGGLAVWQNRIANDARFIRNIAASFASGAPVPIP